MKAEFKLQVANELTALCQASSQAHMAKLLEVSTAIVSQVINNNWKLISNEMWRIIQKRLFIDFEWKTVAINNFKLVTHFLNTAKSQGISVAISDTAGKSKSETFKYFWKQNINNTIYVQCKTSWTKKTYLKALLTAAGQENYGKTEELLNRFIKHLMSLEHPMVILDQADKLKDPQLDLFMDFYNDLNGHCGFMISGVKALEKRILKGVQHKRVGYEEFYSRIGRKFIELDHITLNDVTLICRANGVEDEAEITYIYNNCEDDLRRVRRDIDIYKLKQTA
ncbi:AAA family ATPase [Winogradskyella psychrotolerans]|uniref:AAA family ATPase n=1 Tax=Winogradskyella psychrotolerans TaxID=1344585 RepID=UPI001C067898|nr:AAA family ATPase [Winogradskyella psychrotolerans]MBU2923018.1 AAA family ATPase [Winogradskyella psychrotolerans]